MMRERIDDTRLPPASPTWPLQPFDAIRDTVPAGTSFRKEERTPISLVCKALLGLMAFDVLKLGSNFPKMHRLVANWRVTPRTESGDVALHVWQAVNHACVWYPKRVLCLQRSAVTTCLLRNYGVRAVMAIGAQSLPFKGHAWTEVDGVAVNERRDVQRVYDVLDRC